jgi:hypothetical protein
MVTPARAQSVRGCSSSDQDGSEVEAMNRAVESLCRTRSRGGDRIDSPSLDVAPCACSVPRRGRQHDGEHDATLSQRATENQESNVSSFQQVNSCFEDRGTIRAIRTRIRERPIRTK